MLFLFLVLHVAYWRWISGESALWESCFPCSFSFLSLGLPWTMTMTRIQYLASFCSVECLREKLSGSILDAMSYKLERAQVLECVLVTIRILGTTNRTGQTTRAMLSDC